MAANTAALAPLLETTVVAMGFELVDIELSPRGRLIRLFIDAPQKPGGVDVDDCGRVSDQVTRLLTVENIDYDRLEVSSPGLDRVLKKEQDFIRFAGSRISVKLRQAIEQRRQYQGVLLSLSEGTLWLEPATGQPPLGLPMDQVERVRLAPVF